MAPMIPDWDDRLGRRLRLRDLHILSSVVQFGSMAKATGHLRMSQPSISEAIANLEATLGVCLLDRSPRGIEPTIYADALLKRGLIVFDELRQSIRDIEFLSDPTMGEIRVGCPESLAAGFVPEVINQLSRRYPRIVVHLVPAEPAAMKFRELRNRSVDLMVGRILQPPVDDDLSAETLFDDRYVVAAGACSQWARRRAIKLKDLMNESWIHIPANNAVSAFIADAFHAHGLEMPRGSVTSFSMHSRNYLIATGRYLTIIAESVLRLSAQRWSFKVLDVDLRIPSRPVAIITLKNRTLNPAAALFIEHARAVAKSMFKPQKTKTKSAR